VRSISTLWASPSEGVGPTVLLHEAARLERRAVEVLPACPAPMRLAASVEECFCLVEGRNPPGAGEVWGRILREKRDVDGGTAEALLSRLTPRYEGWFKPGPRS
jgi:hypothetical protein